MEGPQLKDAINVAHCLALEVRRKTICLGEHCSVWPMIGSKFLLLVSGPITHREHRALEKHSLLAERRSLGMHLAWKRRRNPQNCSSTRTVGTSVSRFKMTMVAFWVVEDADLPTLTLTAAAYVWDFQLVALTIGCSWAIDPEGGCVSYRPFPGMPRSKLLGSSRSL